MLKIIALLQRMWRAIPEPVTLETKDDIRIAVLDDASYRIQALTDAQHESLARWSEWKPPLISLSAA